MSSPSARRGSFCGNAGWAFRSLTKTLVNTPPIKATQPKSNQSHGRLNPSGRPAGRILKDMSKQCINQAQAQSGTMTVNFSFQSMRSNIRNGRKKWQKIMIMLTSHHEPFSRKTYQKVSSGILAFQMMKYCEKLM